MNNNIKYYKLLGTRHYHYYKIDTNLKISFQVYVRVGGLFGKWELSCFNNDYIIHNSTEITEKELFLELA